MAEEGMEQKQSGIVKEIKSTLGLVKFLPQLGFRGLINAWGGRKDFHQYELDLISRRQKVTLEMQQATTSTQKLALVASATNDMTELFLQQYIIGSPSEEIEMFLEEIERDARNSQKRFIETGNEKDRSSMEGQIKLAIRIRETLRNNTSNSKTDI